MEIMEQQQKRKSDVHIDDFCSIHTKLTKFNFACSIENFSQRPEKTGESFESPSCVVGSENRSEWCLTIYPSGYNEVYNEYVSIFLHLLKPEKGKAKYRLSILNDKGEEKYIHHPRKVNEFDVNGENDGWGYKDFVKKDLVLNESNGLLINDKLTILCQVEIVKVESENHDSPDTSINLTTPQSEILLDLGNMLDSLMFPDCTIKVGETNLPVHKGILATRSPVFHDILNSTPENSQINVIEIKNFGVEVVKKMLRFIYTDDVSGIENMAIEMLEIAAEYGLDRLKVTAANCLCDDLTVENVCERFILSKKFSSEELEKQCGKFIFGNVQYLRSTGNWKEFVKNHPFLLENLFFKLVDGIPSTLNNSYVEEKVET